MPQRQTRKETRGHNIYQRLLGAGLKVCTKTVSSTWDQVTTLRLNFSSQREFGKWVWSSSKNWPEQNRRHCQKSNIDIFKRGFTLDRLKKPIFMLTRSLLSIHLSFIYYWIPDACHFFMEQSLSLLNIIMFLSAESHMDKNQAVVKYPYLFEEDFENVKWQLSGHKSSVLLICLSLDMLTVAELPVLNETREI